MRRRWIVSQASQLLIVREWLAKAGDVLILHLFLEICGIWSCLWTIQWWESPYVVMSAKVNFSSLFRTPSIQSGFKWIVGFDQNSWLLSDLKRSWPQEAGGGSSGGGGAPTRGSGWSVPEFSVDQTAWQAPSGRRRVSQTPHIPQFYVPVSNRFGVFSENFWMGRNSLPLTIISFKLMVIYLNVHL